MTKVFAYRRFSSDRQADGDSIQRQTTAIEAYCAAHGLSVSEWLEDLGKSAFHGTNRKTGALAKFLGRVIAGEIEAGSILIVESVDRLSREEVMTALDTYTTLINSGLTIVTTMDGLSHNRANYNQEWTKLILTMSKMAVANEESAKKSNRALSIWDKRRSDPSAKKMVAFLPGWLKDIDTPDPARVAIIERIFHEVADLGFGTGRIASRLNADQIESWGPTKKSGLRPTWHNAAVLKIVRGRSVLGDFQPMKRGPDGSKVEAGPVIEGYYPRVIDPTLWHRAQAALNGRSFKGSRGRKGEAYANLFTGLARCGECGSAYHRRSAGKGREYLTCSGAARKICANSRGVPAVRFEAKFLAVVDQMNFSGGKASDIEAKARLAEAEHQRGQTAQRIDGLIEQLLEMKSQALRDRLAEAEARLVEIDQEIADARAALTVIAATPAPNQSQSALVELREALAEPDADVFAIRSRMATTIKEVVHAIMFDASGTATVTMKASLEPYRVTVGQRVVEGTVRAYRFAAKGRAVEATLKLSDGTTMTTGLEVVVDDADLQALRAERPTLAV